MKSARCPYGALTFVILLLLPLAVGCAKSALPLEIDTEYTSVFLDNGQIFVGKLEREDSSYVLLKDVFHIKSWVVQDKDDQSKEVRNTISIRSSEANSPAYTYINVQHILVVEPVSRDSKVSELIKKARAEQKPAS